MRSVRGSLGPGMSLFLFASMLSCFALSGSSNLPPAGAHCSESSDSGQFVPDATFPVRCALLSAHVGVCVHSFP